MATQYIANENGTVGTVEKTEDEIAIEILKSHWLADPCWDIEETPGFESSKAELLAYRMECEKSWRNACNAEIRNKAHELDCSYPLATYILSLEQRLDKLEAG